MSFVVFDVFWHAKLSFWCRLAEFVKHINIHPLCHNLRMPTNHDHTLWGSLVCTSYCILIPKLTCRWSQWPCSLRHELSARSNAGIVGSNVCVRLFCVSVVLCVVGGLATNWCSTQGVLPTVYRIKNRKSGQGPRNVCRTIDELTSHFLLIRV
jgi:hypothetical protein